MSELEQRGISDYGRYRPQPDRAGFERRGFADQLSIETPEQVALSFPVAGIGSRFVALLLDHLIQFGVVVVAGLAFLVLRAAFGSHSGFQELANKWFIASVIFASFLLLWGYFALFEAFWRGQTPGKRAMKLRVIKDSGRQITLFESLARNLLRVADYLPSLYLAGVITMLANKRNKRLGDLAAGTLVVHEHTGDGPLLYTGAARSSYLSSSLLGEAANAVSRTPSESASVGSGPFTAEALGRLSGQDLVVLEAFFARALDLPLETRSAMAQTIASQMVTRMGVAMPNGNPERALEAMAAGLRAGRRRL